MMCILRPDRGDRRQGVAGSEGHSGPKVEGGAILFNTHRVTSTTCSDAVQLSRLTNKEEEILTRKATMSETQMRAVVRMARMQRDLMVVSSLEDTGIVEETRRRSWVTSSSILLALQSPLLAALLHPGADGLSLPFAIDTIADLIAWLHGEVDTMEEEVEQAAKWLGIHVNRPAEKPQKPPQITLESDQIHLLPKVIVSRYHSCDSDEEEMEEPECDRDEVFFNEDEINNSSTPMFSVNDTFDALNFDFSYFSGEEGKETEPEAILTCDQCGTFVCDQCGFRATVEEDLMEHRNSVHRCVHYSCNQCDYESATSDDLTEHMHSDHEGVFIKLFASVFRN